MGRSGVDRIGFIDEAGSRSIPRDSGGGIHNTLYAGLTAGLTEIDRPQYIRTHVELGFGNCTTMVVLRNKMKDDMGIGADDNIAQFRRLNIH
jgi:hypothetical protein